MLFPINFQSHEQIKYLFQIITIPKINYNFFENDLVGWSLHNYFFVLRACEIPRSVSKTVNNFFHYGLHLRPKNKQHIQRR